MTITETKIYTSIFYKNVKYIRIEHIVPDKGITIKWGFLNDVNKCPDNHKSLENTYQSLIK